MQRIDVVVIGGGQAGLSASFALGRLGVEHIVLERGRVGERWRSERWDSLRLLSPNWQTRLPGFSYRGPNPDGYMRAGRFALHLAQYARSFGAPVLAGTTVLRVARKGTAYIVDTDRGRFLALAVIIATGECAAPKLPAWVSAVPSRIYQCSAASYRRPEQLPEGGVLVVGASASGVQLADELRRSGRSVALAVGRHVPLPRHYRGLDIMTWLDWSGILDERPVPRLDAAGVVTQDGPSLQLVGRKTPEQLDLAYLASHGVTLTGHMTGVDGGRALFAADLAQTAHAAVAKQQRLLARIDDYIARSGLRVAPPQPTQAPRLELDRAPTTLDFHGRDIRSIVWATGFVPDYSWLDVPVFDARGRLRQREGVTDAPGLYVLGLRFLRHRNSNLIDGVGRDAGVIAAWVEQELNRRIRRVAA